MSYFLLCPVLCALCEAGRLWLQGSLLLPSCAACAADCLVLGKARGCRQLSAQTHHSLQVCLKCKSDAASLASCSG